MADLLERSRSARFWVLLAAMAALAWQFFPPSGAKYAALLLNGAYRGVYSSAWVGMVTALIGSTLLSLGGFYVVRGTVMRDIQTRVWQLLVTTPMTRTAYLLAKWCSNLIVLVLILVTGVAVGLAAQWVRAEDRTLDLVELFKPVLVLTLPALAMTAMFAVWFDLVPWLRSTAGNLLYFLVWVTLLTVPLVHQIASKPQAGVDAWPGDPAGIVTFVRTINRTDVPELQGKVSSFSILGPAPAKPMLRFAWPRWELRAVDLISPALWTCLALVGVLLGGPCLDWGASQSATPATGTASASGRSLRWLAVGLAPLQASRLGFLVATELQLELRRRSNFWWLAMGGAMLAQAIGSQAVAPVGAIAAWTLMIDSFARTGLREQETGTAALVFSASGAASRLLIARTLMLLGVALVVTLPAMLNLGFHQPAAAAAVVLVDLSLVAWGLALAALVRNGRAFELLFCLLAYFSLQGAFALNISVAPAQTLLWHAALLPVALLIVAIMWPRTTRMVK